MAKSSACYKSINSQRSKIKNTDWPWDKHYTSREGAELGIPSRSELARHTRSSNTSEQRSPRCNSRWQNWKQDSIPAMEMVYHSSRGTAVTSSTCPRARPDQQGHTLPRTVSSPVPRPAHQAHSQTALGLSKHGDSPGQGVLIVSNFWFSPETNLNCTNWTLWHNEI